MLDQRTVVSIGNIYASEALFRAGISLAWPPTTSGLALAIRLWTAIRAVLTEAINMGSTIPLEFLRGGGATDCSTMGPLPGPKPATNDC